MKIDVMTANEQRLRRLRVVLASFYFELYVRQLLGQVLSGGDHARLIEFQQAIQYLDPMMKARLLRLLEEGV